MRIELSSGRLFTFFFVTLLVFPGCAGKSSRADVPQAATTPSTSANLESLFDSATLLAKANQSYEKKEWAEAALEYQRFLDLHLLHPEADLAQFRLGMSYFKQVGSVDRDQDPLLKATAAFKRLLIVFPQSAHAAEAQDTLTRCRILLAEHELYVGRFYYKTGVYQAAVSRLENVLKDFADLPPAAESLYYLALSYQGLGQMDKARQAREDLRTKYPATKYARKAQATP